MSSGPRKEHTGLATARISTYTFDPEKPELAELRAEKRAIWTAALRDEPGYLGELSMDAEDGKQIVIHLWESDETARAALVANNPRLRALVKEQFEPDYDRLWTAPPAHTMATVTMNSLEASNDLDKLYRIVDGLNRKFSDGDSPFKIMTRLCEEAGELAKSVNHFEGTGVKMEKYGAPNRAEFAREIQHVLRSALAVARHYGLEDEMLRSVDETCDNLHRDGWIDAPDE